jgi:hypothetical protein
MEARFGVPKNNSGDSDRTQEIDTFRETYTALINAMQDRFVSNLLTTTLFDSEYRQC